MKIDSGQIDRVSTLSRLKLSDAEKEEFSRQLSDIVSYVEKINELDTENVEPADHIIPINNVFRNDRTEPSIGIDSIERMAPEFDKGHIVVPPVIEGAE